MDRRAWGLMVAVAVVGTAATLRTRAQSAGGENEQAMLHACELAVDEEVAEDGHREGFGRGGGIRFEDGANFLPKKNNIEISGMGEFHYGREYLWEPMTFKCEWDTKKGRIKKGDYKKAKGATGEALPPPLERAVSDCRRAVHDEIEREARRREYSFPSIGLKSGIAFGEGRDGRRLDGLGHYKLDSVQKNDTDFEFSCEWDEERDRVRLRTIDRRSTLSGEIGEITCESRNNQKQTCKGPIGGRVRLVDQRSKTDCVQGTNWTYSSRAIEVWDGCRARFEFDMR
ncbi:MAG: DUF3011 domain-containing protein [Vicinamibacterales bacterium]